MSVIALPSVGKGGLNTTLSLRFGRCENITIVTIEDKSIEAIKVIPIQRDKVLGNLGIYIAKIIKENEVSNVLVGFIGPKAYDALNSKGIGVYKVPNNYIRLKQIIELYNQEKLDLLKESNAHLIKN
jgi:predicted Fe-Mo cluster-binding NifX family protein